MFAFQIGGHRSPSPNQNQICDKKRLQQKTQFSEHMSTSTTRKAV